MEKKRYECPKCGCHEYTAEDIQTTGGNFSKLFDVQNRKFTAISCNRCGYTELYRRQGSTAMDVLDFFLN